MSLPDVSVTRMAGFPPALRALLDAELAAGNAIAEVGASFPAPPAGAYVKLTRPITTRPRVKTAEIDFYDRNSSIYSGEWTDAKRFFFILEPPHPPEPEVDMDAVRDARRAAAIAADRHHLTESPRVAPRAVPEKRPVDGPTHARTLSVVERFENGMEMDYEKWHDGTGYDLSILKEASPADIVDIERLLLSRGTNDWRDVEALAALNTIKAKKALKGALTKGTPEVRTAVLRHAPELASATRKISVLVKGLRTAEFYGGLTQTLDQVVDFHPPAIVAELFRGALERKGEIAVHFAAMLMFIHGKAPEPFDWDQRPFFLRFHTETRKERETVFRELCAKVGVKAEKFLKRR
jgi:hypothetical protein